MHKQVSKDKTPKGQKTKIKKSSPHSSLQRKKFTTASNKSNLSKSSIIRSGRPFTTATTSEDDSTITKKQKSLSIPLNVPFPTTTKFATESERIDAVPKMSRLSNGIKVITQDSTLPIVYINARIEVGSMYENPKFEETGLTHILARTLGDFSQSLVQRLPHGTDVSTYANRENMDILVCTIGPTKDAMEVLSGLINTASWAQVDALPDLKSYYLEHGIPAHLQTPSERFQDDIYLGAFFGHGLANPTFPSAEPLQTMTTQKLVNWQSRFFRANRITIGAVGINHEDFVKACETHLGSLESSPETFSVESEESIDFRVLHRNVILPNENGEEIVGPVDPHAQQHVALTWHGPDINSPFLVPMGVLSTAIGSSRTFSSGGPGKGMYARATTHLLSPRSWVSEVSSQFVPHNRTSLFTLMGVVDAPQTNRFIDDMLSELTSMASTLTDEEVERAKNQLKRELFVNYEPASSRVTELTRHASVYGRWRTDELIGDIDKVTTSQVQQSAKLLFDTNAVLVTTLGNPRAVGPKWFTRNIADPNSAPFTQEELDRFHDSKSGDSPTMSKLKSLFKW